jgi:hypothetical protein
MVQESITRLINDALESIQQGQAARALEQVDEALALIDAPWAETGREDGLRPGPQVLRQLRLLHDLHDQLTAARDAVASADPFSMATTKLSFALCSAHILDAVSREA